MSSQAWAVLPPYSEGFDSEAICAGFSCGPTCSLANGWIQASGDDFDWFVDDSTGSSSTGPSDDHLGGGQFAYAEASTCTADTASLITPPLELGSAQSPVADFWYHMYGQTMGTLHLDVLDASLNVLATDVISPLTDDVDLWQLSPQIDLSSYVGQTIHLQFRATIGTDFYSDIAIDDFNLYEIFADDVGVVSIDTPANGCNLGNAETISVTLENFGSASQTGFPVEYSINGGTAVSETFTGTLAPLSTATFTFSTAGDVSAAGLNTLTAGTVLSGDADTSNDVASTSVYNGNVINAFPALVDFEGATASLDWFVGGASPSWELGTPDDTTIDTAFSGTNSWITGITANYNSSEDSFVQSLCGYDFSALTNPAVNVATFTEMFDVDDGAALMASTDGGTTWNVVGSATTGLNWYNSAAITANPGGQSSGWTDDTTDMWLLSRHEASTLAGQGNVLFRFAFASDSASVDDGFAFDDFEVFDNVTEEVVVTNFGPTPPAGAVAPGATNILAHSFVIEAFGVGSKDLTAVTITNPGTLADADAAAVGLWVDDGDGVFDPSLDTLLDTQTLSGGMATFGPALSIPTLSSRLLYVSYDLAGTAMSGDTFASQIAAPTTDLVFTGSPTITVTNAPVEGPVLTVAGIVSMLPFEDDMSGLPANRSVQYMAGSYPSATAVGTTVSSTSFTNDALIEVLASSTETTLLPASGGNFAAIHFPNAHATGAIDYHFDLSAYNAANDPLLLQVRWGDTGEESDDEDYIFISLDGGATWAAALFEWPWSTDDEVWTDETIDLSAFLSQNGLNYTNDVVIRLQANDASALGVDGLLVDRVWLGRPQKAILERPVGTVIADDGMDPLGPIAATPQSLAYTLRNDGDQPLDWSAIQSANETNVTNVVITPPTTDPIPAGGDATFQVDFEAGIGAFSFELDILFVDEPNLWDNKLDWTVSGEGNEAVPEIDVQRPEGTSIASGMNDPQGELVPGMTQTLTYTVANLGFADLNVTGVAIENADNVTALVTTPPATLLAPNETTTFDVELSANANGAWSFDVVVANDDADEAPYTITVDGTADDGMGGEGGGGMGGAGGAGAGGGGVGGSTGDGGSAPADGTDEDGGCGCEVPGGANGSDGRWALIGLALAFGVARRRRR